MVMLTSDLFCMRSTAKQMLDELKTRVQIAVNIEVRGPDRPSQVVLQDISLEEGRFVSERPVGEVGESLSLLLPMTGDQTFEVPAHIVRVTATNDGYDVGVRFTKIDRAEQSLDAALDVLVATGGGGNRKHARIKRRIDLRYGNLLQLRGQLDDISGGGLAIRMSDPPPVGEELSVILPDTTGADLLMLKTTVLHARPTIEHDVQAYLVGLSFANLSPERRACLEVLLKTLVHEP
jgi:c-di-GMP-binding flagellar brake protein YcgR